MRIRKVSLEASNLAEAHDEAYLTSKVKKFADNAFAAKLAGDDIVERAALKRMRIYEDALAIRSAREASKMRSAP